MLQYPVPEEPWDIVSIDLLQLPKSQYGSRYLLVCVDHLTRYVVLAPLKDKTATAGACTGDTIVLSFFRPTCHNER